MSNNQLSNIYSKILSSTEDAMNKVLQQAVNVAYDYIRTEWYSKHPNGLNDNFANTYKRTGELLDSLKIKCTKVNNGVIGELYISNEQHSPSNSWNQNPVSFKDLYSWFERVYSEQGILDFTKEYLITTGEALNIIKRTLRENGLNIQ